MRFFLLCLFCELAYVFPMLCESGLHCSVLSVYLCICLCVLMFFVCCLFRSFMSMYCSIALWCFTISVLYAIPLAFQYYQRICNERVIKQQLNKATNHNKKSQTVQYTDENDENHSKVMTRTCTRKTRTKEEHKHTSEQGNTDNHQH